MRYILLVLLLSLGVFAQSIDIDQQQIEISGYDFVYHTVYIWDGSWEPRLCNGNFINENWASYCRIDISDLDPGTYYAGVYACTRNTGGINCPSDWTRNLFAIQDPGSVSRFVSTPGTYTKGSGQDLVVEIADDYPTANGVAFQIWHRDEQQIQATTFDGGAPYVYPSSVLDTASNGVANIQALIQFNGQFLGKIDFDTNIMGPEEKPDGVLTFKKWLDIDGSALSDLTSNARFPNSPSSVSTISSFEIPINAHENYGVQVQGYIYPPISGAYTFWMASDNEGSLYLSTDQNPATKRQIAGHSGYTGIEEWDRFPTQKSATINLEAGKKYYIEALMKEGVRGDHLSVAWSYPGQDIVVIGQDYIGSYQSVDQGLVCGNGIVESGEVCDDGNVLNGDGCSVTCQIEQVYACGDGLDNDGDGLVDLADPGCANANDNDETNVVVSGQTQIKVYTSTGSPYNDNLGASIFDVYQSQSSRAFIDVINEGNSGLQVSNIRFSGSAARDYSYEIDDNRVVPPGEKLRVWVEFSPTATGQRNAFMDFDVNTAQGSYRINLYGSGKEGEPPKVTPTTQPDRETTDRITQHGITWIFDKQYQYGVFANGDFWVQGPVKLTGIRVDAKSGNPDTPRDGRNGFEISPGIQTGQAYDNRAYDYNSERQPSFPVTVQPGNNIVSSVSSKQDVGSGGFNSAVFTIAILTVVDQIPPGRGSDVFRPSYVQPDEPYRYVSELRLDRVPSVEAPSGVPSLVSVTNKKKKVQFMNKMGWRGGSIRPMGNQIPYPVGTTAEDGEAMLLLALDSFTLEEKMPLLLARVQTGIDLYGMAKKGANWYADGGVHPGRLFPIVFAGHLLNDAGMLGVSKTNEFAELQQTFYTTKNPPKPEDFPEALSDPKPGCYRELPSKYAVNVPGMGMAYARYGIRHQNHPNHAGLHGEYHLCSNPKGYSTYWALNGPSWSGQTCAARLFGFEDAIDDPAYFDHVDRLMDFDRDNLGQLYYKAFNDAMWYKHCDPWR